MMDTYTMEQRLAGEQQQSLRMAIRIVEEAFARDAAARDAEQARKEREEEDERDRATEYEADAMGWY